MDADHGRNRDREGAPTKTFKPSLFVWAMVMSRPIEDRAIVDAGLKALALFRPAAGLRRARHRLRARLRRAWKARHLGRHEPPQHRRQGPPHPGHCDPTVNLYDWYLFVRGNPVEQLWPLNTPRRGVLMKLSIRHA